MEPKFLKKILRFLVVRKGTHPRRKVPSREARGHSSSSQLTLSSLHFRGVLLRAHDLASNQQCTAVVQLPRAQAGTPNTFPSWNHSEEATSAASTAVIPRTGNHLYQISPRSSFDRSKMASPFGVVVAAAEVPPRPSRGCYLLILLQACSRLTGWLTGRSVVRSAASVSTYGSLSPFTDTGRSAREATSFGAPSLPSLDLN